MVTIAAYRDRYDITGTQPLGSPADTTADRADASYARAALDHARRLSTTNAAWQAADRDTPGRPTIERSL
ncbi:hypothetical protein [Phytoactinopolyspora limicola]|uniref:hypothetical protein n=1 Tax=Phytoactinopolyspora limicola TaxID=2715536 RepID=UPI00140DB15E|nr:hypothetical protein [Phytoactinopolyspora limicola]